MVAQFMEDKRTTAASGYVKVQTSDDTCEGVCATKKHNENTREPRLLGLFETSY